MVNFFMQVIRCTRRSIMRCIKHCPLWDICLARIANTEWYFVFYLIRHRLVLVHLSFILSFLEEDQILIPFLKMKQGTLLFLFFTSRLRPGSLDRNLKMKEKNKENHYTLKFHVLQVKVIHQFWPHSDFWVVLLTLIPSRRNSLIRFIISHSAI